MQLPDVPFADIDLSLEEFWTAPRDWREGAFKTFRDTAEFQFFPERLVEGAPLPAARATSP